MKDPLRLNAIHLVDSANANRILLDVNVRHVVPVITDSPTAKSAIVHPRHFVKRIQEPVFVHLVSPAKSVISASPTLSALIKSLAVNSVTVIRWVSSMETYNAI